MQETKPRTLSVRLDAETFRRLRVLAAERDQPMQALAEEAIREKIEKGKAEK